MNRMTTAIVLLACWATLAWAKPPAKVPAKAPAKSAAPAAGRPSPAAAAPQPAAAPAPPAKAAAATDTGTAITAADIREDHFADRKVLATLAVGEAVQILGSSGAWLQVKSAKATGWLRALAIRRTGAGKGTDNASGVLGLTSGRAGTGKVVATTGIRGLTEEDLKAAKFNAEQLTLLESFGATRPQAQEFAKEGNLQAAPLAELPPEGAR